MGSFLLRRACIGVLLLWLVLTATFFAFDLAPGDIVDRFDLSQPTISHHLKILRDAGLLVTRSSEVAGRLMQGLQAGVVTINDVLYSFGEPAATWSGYRKSGMGQNHGTPGLREMSRQRFVSFDATTAEAPVFAFPYDDTAGIIARGAIDHLHAPRRLRRLRGLLRLVRQRRFRSRLSARGVAFAKKRHVR